MPQVRTLNEDVITVMGTMMRTQLNHKYDKDNDEYMPFRHICSGDHDEYVIKPRGRAVMRI